LNQNQHEKMNEINIEKILNKYGKKKEKEQSTEKFKV
jgi:hypothetical protein